MENVVGYILASLIGVSLGLIGGGGSILALPVLVYVFGINTIEATAYSLFIVGITSMAGSLMNIRKGAIDLKAVLLFSIPSLVSVFLVRKFLIPILPDVIVTTSVFTISKETFLLLVFSILMLVAGAMMITGKCLHCDEKQKVQIKINYSLIVAEGLVIGAITGLVGAGGGFLVIPALVMYAGLSMKQAVGTSLLIIAIKSLVGFSGDVMNSVEINWVLLTVFSAIAIVGMYVGTNLQELFSEKWLRRIFGIFVIVLSIGILIKELL
jgi:uncharacterized membrane protein YfcA